jgi:hypothetical protein
MSDTDEMPAGRIGGRLCAREPAAGRGIRRNLKAKLTCFSPVLSGGGSARLNPGARSDHIGIAVPAPTQPSPVGEGEPRSGGIDASTSGIVL